MLMQRVLKLTREWDSVPHHDLLQADLNTSQQKHKRHYNYRRGKRLFCIDVARHYL